MSKNKYRPYPKYKPSGIDWLGDIPEWWELLKVKHLFKISEEASFEANPTILSLTQHGIKKRDISNNEGQIASSYSGYRKISIGDVVLNIMDLLSGFVDRSQYNGVISPAYATLKPTKKIETKYFNYFFQKHYFEKIFFPFGQGVSVDHRWTLKDFTLLNFPIIKPTFEEQEKIAKFLDNKLEKIDQIIEKNNHLVELLHEKRQAVITRAVTKGLDPRARLKPSGIDWLGDIPEDWEVKRLKYVSYPRVSNVDKKSEDDIKVMLCNYIDVYKNDFIDENIDFMEATAKINQIDNFELKHDDILITKDSETPDDIGISAYVKLKDTVKIVCGYHLAIITPNKPSLIGRYLFRLFHSKLYRSQFEISCNGVTRFGLNSYIIFNINVILPPLPEQKNIADYIDDKTAKIDEMTKKVELQNQKLQEFRQALISSAVTGKIQV